jgi:hypothetical protein
MLKAVAGRQPIICALMSAKNAGTVEGMKSARIFVSQYAGHAITKKRLKMSAMIAELARMKPTEDVMSNVSRVMNATQIEWEK